MPGSCVQWREGWRRRQQEDEQPHRAQYKIARVYGQQYLQLQQLDRWNTPPLCTARKLCPAASVPEGASPVSPALKPRSRCDPFLSSPPSPRCWLPPAATCCSQVPTVQRFRKGLPEKSKVKVTKNSLMRAACQQVDGWSTVIEKGCQVRRLAVLGVASRVDGDEQCPGGRAAGCARCSGCAMAGRRPSLKTARRCSRMQLLGSHRLASAGCLRQGYCHRSSLQ
jgi:hypothetical protein